MTPTLPLTHDVVLIGGGHSHALVLRMWAMKPLAGARLTLINPGPTAPYSGMLPGFVAGHYTRDALDIDLVRLARFAGARVINAAANHLDLDAGKVHLSNRPPVSFDLASVDVGITSQMPDIPGFAEYAIPAKPLGPFAEAWDSYRAGSGPGRVAVIGGGVAGAELAAATAHALRAGGRASEVTLIDAAQAFTALRPATAAKLRAALVGLNIRILEDTPVTSVSENAVHLASGEVIEAEFILGAAGARPHPWLAQSGLDLQDGYIRVNAELQSSDPRIFAAGDCAHFAPDPRPKAGVYAVRQAPVLLHNLQAQLAGQPLRRYRPQKDYLKLISLGGKRALAERFGMAPEGAGMWRWKDRIDRRFMQQFQSLPAMATPALPERRTETLAEAMGDKPLCGGCGAKVGRGALQQVLHTLPRTGRADVTLRPGDDAAVLRMGEHQQVLTTDHLRAFTDDAYMLTRIAAQHALGDIWAMGATPQAVTANLILPRQTPALQSRQLSEIMAAASEVFTEAGAEIVGGHSSLGDELTIGFSITGLLERAPITLAGAQPGDRLILTKPIGAGIVLAAEMAGLARGANVVAVMDMLAQSQQRAARHLAEAHAMTDVTGFGLAGHLRGICDASGLSAVITPDTVPTLPGAQALAAQGVRSSLYADNRAAVPELPEQDDTVLLFDPQTSGGLLAAVAPDRAAPLLAALSADGYRAADIGWVEAGPPQIRLD